MERGERDSVGSPDELPLSPVGLPEMEDEDIFGDFEDLPLDNQGGLPEELPLSPGGDGSAGGGMLSPASGLGLEEGLPIDLGAPQEMESPEEEEPRLLPVPAVGTKRAGRPNAVLQDALKEARRRFGEQGAAGQDGLVGAVGIPRCPAPDAARNLILPAPSRAQLLSQCSVSTQAMGNILKRPFEGYAQLSPVARCAAACAKMGRLEGERKDEDVFEASLTLLANGPLNLTSKRLRAEALHISDAQLDALLPMLAGNVVLMDRLKRAEAEKAMATCLPKVDLLMYFDFCAYDETPLSTAMRGEKIASKNEHGHTPLLAHAKGSHTDALCTLGADAQLLLRLPMQRSAQRVLQTVQSGGILLKVDGRFVTVISNIICSLQILPDGTGATLKNAELMISGVSRAATQFDHKARLTTTDGCQVNLLAEKLIASERGDTWTNLHVCCDVHRTAGAHTKTFSLMDSHVTGMVHTALALQSGSAMNRFRKCLRDEVASRFVVLHGTVSADAMRYKRQILRLFVSHGSRLAVRRILLALCPNGDWRSEQVQYYVPPGAPERSKEAYLDHVTSGLIASLCAAQPATYPRHRWTGADLAIDCLGVMEACHRLLSTTFERFVASSQSTFSSRSLQGAIVGLPLGAHQGEGPEPEDAGERELLGGLAGEGVGTSAIVEPPGGPPQAEVEMDSTTWAAVNAKHRRMALEWLRTRPLPMLILQRTAMEPMRQLLAEQFRVAGADWEDEQRGRLAEALASDKPVTFGDRDYRLGLAAEGKDEDRFFQQLGILFEQPVMWEVVPLASYTVGFHTLAFKCLSRSGCCVLQLLQQPHKQFPIRLFALLRRPELAEEMASEPACLLDPWSLEMRRRHPTLSGEVFMQKLALAAQLVWKDISPVESKHATIRRFLTALSVQTHSLSAATLAALWCLLQFRRRAKHCAGEFSSTPGGGRKAAMNTTGGL